MPVGGGGVGGMLVGGGGNGGCTQPSGCPGETCRPSTCINGVCGMGTAADNTACNDNGGTICTGGQCVPWSPTDLPGLALWLRGDLGVSTSGSSVTAWANQGSLGGSFTQAAGPMQPGTATLGANTVVRYDGVDDSLQHDGAASDWTFLHDGSGATIYLVFRPGSGVGAAFDTLRNSDGRVGSMLLIANNEALWLVGAGMSPFVLEPKGPALTGSAHVVVLRMESGAAPEYSLRIDGTAIASGSFANTPNSGDPYRTLQLGNQVDGGLPYNGDILEMGALTSNLTMTDVARLESYLTVRYGL